jgi:hypothetical protein
MSRRVLVGGVQCHQHKQQAYKAAFHCVCCMLVLLGGVQGPVGGSSASLQCGGDHSRAMQVADRRDVVGLIIKWHVCVLVLDFLTTPRGS